jgi:hypothetical protein
MSGLPSTIMGRLSAPDSAVTNPSADKPQSTGPDTKINMVVEVVAAFVSKNLPPRGEADVQSPLGASQILPPGDGLASPPRHWFVRLSQTRSDIQTRVSRTGARPTARHLEPDGRGALMFCRCFKFQMFQSPPRPSLVVVCRQCVRDRRTVAFRPGGNWSMTSNLTGTSPIACPKCQRLTLSTTNSPAW